MLSARKSLGDLSAIRKGQTLQPTNHEASFGSSRRHHPLSSRLSFSQGALSTAHSPSVKHRRQAKRLWRVGATAVRFLIRAKRSTTLPQLGVDEIREITSRFYSVMCLNSVATVAEFASSLGVNLGSEDTRLLTLIRFHEGRALTLYQVLRLMTILKRQHLASCSTDTAEAFGALAVDGYIPTDVFKKTLMKFDLRVNVEAAEKAASTVPLGRSGSMRDPDFGGNGGSGVGNSSSNGGGDVAAAAVRGIDLAGFANMLSRDEDAVPSSSDVSRRLLVQKSSSVKDSVTGKLTAEDQSTASALGSEGRGGLTQLESPNKPSSLDFLLGSVKSNLEHQDGLDALLKGNGNGMGHGSHHHSPLRSEVFPFRMNNRPWVFKDVLQRIEEVEHRGDVHRHAESRNVRYCSDEHRPPLALLTPFTDLGKAEGKKKSSSSHSLRALRQLQQLPPRGLPEEARRHLHSRRAASSTFDDRYPALAQRRSRMMDALPHRVWQENGHVAWALTPSQRNDLASRLQRGRGHGDSDDEPAFLKRMASATLQAMSRGDGPGDR